ncbi:MAG: phosphotransferase [Verrucomicrobiales bacterium]|nr:phosphotransferase [Verrucomicrobiales bacterium]
MKSMCFIALTGKVNLDEGRKCKLGSKVVLIDQPRRQPGGLDEPHISPGGDFEDGYDEPQGGPVLGRRFPHMQPGADPALRAVIESIPQWNGRNAAVAPIQAGITNRNFKVEIDGEAFVVRIPGVDTHLLGIDRAVEHAMACAAAAAGAGPEVFAYLPDSQILITRFVAGVGITEEELQNEPRLTAVVRSLKRIHSCPALAAGFPVFRVVQDYLKVAMRRGADPSPEMIKLAKLGVRIEEALNRNAVTKCPCHNDLLNANLLREGDHIWVVDYEYAGMGDPFFDLGNLSINNGFGPETDETLLRCYFSAVTNAHRARLQLMKIVSDLREAAWGTIQQAISSLDCDYRSYADRHATRGLRTAAAPRFREWMAAV